MILKNKNAVVTGVSRGIGKSILKVFAQNGANIWACLRKQSKEFDKYKKQLEKQNSIKIIPIYFDLENSKQIKIGFEEIKRSKSNIDILVNNAGEIFTALFQMTSFEQINRMLQINFVSQMLFTQYISRQMMKQRNGNIINLSSSAALHANQGRMAYASSKAALITATKVLARELGPYNIRANVVAPGLTDTEMMKNSTSNDALNKTLNSLCLKRVADPDEIAKSILFLSSDLSSYITGHVLRVDGGM
ncbi:MAG: 3-oxoacyl-ACP reductase [bacterium TMED264]|nr:MAG: 3-oxoacyl-ACP reductase [bacterium TMED264]|tara:strand:+ start:484 stop:1227 length:744 start_codon:yes stop_codon:yes gene_type:complete